MKDKLLARRVIAGMMVLTMLLSCLPGVALTSFASGLATGQDTTVPDSTAEATVATTLSAETTVPSEPVALETVDAAEETVTLETSVAMEVTEPATDPTVAAPPLQSAPPAMLSSMNYGIETAAETKGGDSSGNVNKPSSGTYKPPEGSASAKPDNYEIYYNAVGVTMQVVFFPYKDSYNRNNSYDNVIGLIKNYKYTDENGDKIATVFDGLTVTDNTFIGDSVTGRIYKLNGINMDQSSDLYKTTPLITGRYSKGGGTIDPGYQDCVSGPATVTEVNGKLTYTMPEPTDIEKFLKHIIFGGDYGAWDKSSIAIDENGDATIDPSQDVSLFTQLLRLLGCEEQYIENYLKSYYGYLSVTEDGDTMVPTIIWSYIMVDAVEAWDANGHTVYGHGYTGSGATTEDITYVDPYAVACCSGISGESTNHGKVSNVTFATRRKRILNASVQTVGDVVYQSFVNNIYTGEPRGIVSKKAAGEYWDLWWKGCYLQSTSYSGGKLEYWLKKADGTYTTIKTDEGFWPIGHGTGDLENQTRYAYQSYHNAGAAGNNCSWFYGWSYSCLDLLGAHAAATHDDHIAQRNYYGRHAIGSGYVNSINGQGVDNDEGRRYYFRNYWTPYGEMQTGTLQISKDVSSEDTAATTDLEGWAFELFATEADAEAGKNIIRTEYTDSTGSALFQGLRYGETFYIKEAPASRQNKHTTSGWTTEDEIFVGEVPQDTTFVVGTATNTYIPGRMVSIQKSPSCSSAVYDQIKDNPLYSLAGAEYTLYLDGVQQEVLTTDATGYAVSQKIYTVGANLVLRETKAPAGFRLSSKEYPISITDGENLVEVEDTPVFDPVTLTFEKSNASTGGALGNTSYEGAIFKWEYFTNSNWSGTPERTWYFETDADGYHSYETAYLLDTPQYPSSDLYLNAENRASLPLGSLIVTEIIAPYGYALMNSLYATIAQDSDGSIARFYWTEESKQYILSGEGGQYQLDEPTDESTFGNISVQKMDADLRGYFATQGDVPSLKTQFKIINRSANAVKIGDYAVAQPGEVCFDFWTDEDGGYDSQYLFPIGTYEIAEMTPPTGMTLNTSWSRTFEVKEGKIDFDFSGPADALYNEVIRGGVKIYKYDSVAGESTTQEHKLSGISYSVISQSTNPVIVGGQTYTKGQVVATMELGWNATEGKWIASLPGDTLPYGTYSVVENEKAGAPNYANDYYLHSDTSYTFAIRTDSTIVSKDTANSSMAFHNEPTGILEIQKATTTGTHLEGWPFAVKDSTGTEIPGSPFVTDAQGQILIENLLPGTYTVQELASEEINWECDTSVHTVTVVGGTVTTETITNTRLASLIVRKAMLTEGPLDGWVFEVGLDDGEGNYTSYTTDETGLITIDNLLPGTYEVEEIIPEGSLYHLIGNSARYIEILPDQDNILTFENALRPGAISVEKVDYFGQHLAGAEFLLEWSEDGITWSPVTFYEGEHPIKGGCSSAGLIDGKLTTAEDGIITFTNLHPGLQYRMTETKAPEGYVLLADYAFNGTLPADQDFTVSLKVYNSQGYLLPSTGAEGFTGPIALGSAMFLFAMLSGVMWVSHITRKPQLFVPVKKH